MKRLFSTTIALLAFPSAILIGGNLPVISQLTQPAAAQIAATQKPIVLKLTQSKKIADSKGFKLVPVTKALPGDTIVYTIAANNISNRAIKNLVINQKIRTGTTYVLNSATPVKGTTLAFSVNGGKSFVASPVFNKKPAQAATYTNIKWAFTSSIAPKTQNILSYEVRVR